MNSFDQAVYRARTVEELYRRNCALVEQTGEMAQICADYDDDHVSALVWSAQQALQRVDLALRERR